MVELNQRLSVPSYWVLFAIMSYLARFISVSLGLVLLFVFCVGGTCDSVYAQTTQPEKNTQQPGSELKNNSPSVPEKTVQPPGSGTAVVPQPADRDFKKISGAPPGAAKQDVYIKGDDGQYFPLPNLSLIRFWNILNKNRTTRSNAHRRMRSHPFHSMAQSKTIALFSMYESWC